MRLRAVTWFVSFTPIIRLDKIKVDMLGEVWSEMRNTYTILAGKVMGR
jgi:hypothetical protein